MYRLFSLIFLWYKNVALIDIFQSPVTEPAYFWSTLNAYWRSCHSKQRCLKHGKSFHRAGGDLIANGTLMYHINNVKLISDQLSGATYNPPDLKRVTTESRNVGLCMIAASCSRLNCKMYDKLSTDSCFEAICTKFSDPLHMIFLVVSLALGKLQWCYP